MAPPLRLQDWSRLYQDPEMMRLYRRRSDDLNWKGQQTLRWCDTSDPESALRTLAFSDPSVSWTLYWLQDPDDFVPIADSEGRQHWQELLLARA